MNAPPAAVWPWLGQGRGGLYSYDWLENLLGLHMHSARRVRPDLQHVRVGDTVRLVPEGTQPPLHFAVAQVERRTSSCSAPSALARRPSKRTCPIRAGRSRCRRRTATERASWSGRSDFRPTLAARLAYKWALLPVHFVIQRKMLLGIRDRVEGTS